MDYTPIVLRFAVIEVLLKRKSWVTQLQTGVTGVYTGVAKIRYTKHANKKFQDHVALGISVDKRLIRSILTRPRYIDTTSDDPRTIVSGMLDADHILSIVYRKEYATILVITFYPAAVRRYRV